MMPTLHSADKSHSSGTCCDSSRAVCQRMHGEPHEHSDCAACGRAAVSRGIGHDEKNIGHVLCSLPTWCVYACLQKERMCNTLLASYALASINSSGSSLPLYSFMKAQITAFLLACAIDFDGSLSCGPCSIANY